MKRVTLCSFVLLAWPVGSTAGQSLSAGSDEGADDYRAHFGDATTHGGRPQPQSLDEARAMRRGYRLGQRARGTTAGEAEGGAVHLVQEGETLWSISGQYLGDHWQWPRLWAYNPEITNPHWIYPQHPIRLTPSTSGSTTAGKAVANAPSAGGTAADRVVVVSDEQLRAGMVFLRDQGYLDDEALATLGEIIGAPEEQMILSTSDHAYVAFSGDEPPRAGEELAVFRQLQAWERYPAERGTLVRILGTVVVDSFDDNTGVARVTVSEALDVIERGFHVARVPRRFDLVEPKQNATDLTARIIASTQPRGLIGFGDVVFLDVGQETGVEAGNRFFVVRRGDEFLEGIRGRESEVGALAHPPDYHPERMPQEVVAELRVVKVRKDTTIALVTRTDTDLAYGDKAEMRVGF